MALRLHHHPGLRESHTVLYVVADHPDPLAWARRRSHCQVLVLPIQRGYDYLQCGILAYALSAWDVTPKHEIPLAFSCKRRGFCPSCVGWPRPGPPPRASNPWSPRSNGSCRCPSPATGAHHRNTAKVHDYCTAIAVLREPSRQTASSGRRSNRVADVSPAIGGAINLKVFDVGALFVRTIVIPPARLCHGVGSRVLIPLG